LASVMTGRQAARQGAALEMKPSIVNVHNRKVSGSGVEGSNDRHGQGLYWCVVFVVPG